MDWKSFINSIEPGDWGTMIAAFLALFASIITIFSSKKSASKSDELNDKLGVLQANTQDKQRIVETIGAQRVVWINNVRQHFVDYNSNAQSLHFNYGRLNSANNQEMINNFLEKTLELASEMSKTIITTELFLNSEEIYSNATIRIMTDFRQGIMNPDMSIDQFNEIMRGLIFAQNVILKAEWKRVKEETSIGDFLLDERVKKIFIEVATKVDEDMHNFIIEKYSN